MELPLLALTLHDGWWPCFQLAVMALFSVGVNKGRPGYGTDSASRQAIRTRRSLMTIGKPMGVDKGTVRQRLVDVGVKMRTLYDHPSRNGEIIAENNSPKPLGFSVISTSLGVQGLL